MELHSQCYPITRSVHSAPPGPVGNEALGIGLHDGSKIYILGGLDYNKGKKPVNMAYEYTPGEGTGNGKWRQLEKMTVTLRGACGFII